MSSNITIKQIAKMAGVSVSAVSIVLNGKKGVSETTRDRVLTIINDTNYTPNVNSRRLILQRSFNILLVIDPETSPLSNTFYTAVMNSIVTSGAQMGYNIVLTTISDSFRNSRLEATLLQHNADGVIFLRDISSEWQSNIQETGVPFVVVDSQKKSPTYPCIQADYTLSSYRATRHLIENGHTRIAIIGMNRIPDYYMRSFEGYQAALIEEGLPIRPDWIQPEAFDELSAKECIKNILKCSELPTAVFCVGDLFAISVMNYLQDVGYSLPADFSVCSIDDIVLARYYHPALTTIQIDKHAMGHLAVDMLDKLINGIETETNYVVRSDELMVRDSVKNIKC